MINNPRSIFNSQRSVKLLNVKINEISLVVFSVKMIELLDFMVQIISNDGPMVVPEGRQAALPQINLNKND